MAMDKLIIIFSFGLLCLIGIIEAQIVNTNSGPVQGKNFTSRNGRTFSAFMGIPYGKAPVGNLRFKSPEPVEPWTEVRDATSFGSWCPQVVYIPPVFLDDKTRGEEDCLTINVFTPKNLDDDSAPLPVLVKIHGGYFMYLGSGYYGPRYFMDEDIVLVTINYRLGVLGYVSTQDENSPGNVGMKDMLLALKWVQDNIHNFGGDRARVTVYGESSSAAGVQYLLLSPTSKGLFSAAISSSGTAFKVNSFQVDPLGIARKISAEVGCGEHNEDNARMVECLRATNSSEFALLTDEFTKVLKDPMRIYSPSVELEGTSTDPFLTAHPYEVFISGGQSSVPWLLGVNSGEGLITTLNALSKRDEWVPKFNSEWLDLAPEFLIYNESHTDWTEKITNSYLSLYRHNRTIDFDEDLAGFTDMFTDRLYVHSSIHAAKFQARRSPVYFYYNDFFTSRNVNGLGVNHGEEIALLFSPGNFEDPIIDEGHPDYEQSKVMVSIFAQFATNPHNVKYEDRTLPPIAPDHNNNTLNCFLFINGDRGQQGVSTIPQNVIDRVNFWEDNGIPPYQDYAKV